MPRRNIPKRRLTREPRDEGIFKGHLRDGVPGDADEEGGEVGCLLGGGEEGFGGDVETAD